MPLPANLPTDFLRSFVAGVDLGGLSAAATRLGRSASTLSLQIDRLEEIAGTALFTRKGRGLALTEAGAALLPYARRMLALNDEALTRLADLGAMAGWLRLGLAEDLAEGWLPGLLGRFTRAHPELRLELQSGRGSQLTASLAAGDLDLALFWTPDGTVSPGDACLQTLPIRWIGAQGQLPPASGPLPLLAMSSPCHVRDRAITALEAEGRDWHLALSSHGLAGIWAAARAGLGITPRAIAAPLPEGLAPLPDSAGLPGLGETHLILRHASASPPRAALRLAQLIRDELETSR